MISTAIYRKGLHFLHQYWQKHCTLEDWHIQWALKSIQQITQLRKNDILYHPTDRQRNIYLVIQGALARCTYDSSHNRRQLLTIALPGMALMTTNHLYSLKPSSSAIVVLAAQTKLLCIPYRAILKFEEQEPQLHILMNILSNKKKKQLLALTQILHVSKPFERYLTFSKSLPELARNLTQTQQAELLNISRKTVQRTQKRLLSTIP